MSEGKLPSIDRRDLLVIAVAIMCVTAMPGTAAAANEELVVGSQHDTASELDAGTNKNLTTTTSADDGGLTLKESESLIDGFEDGDLSEWKETSGVQIVSNVTEGGSSYALQDEASDTADDPYRNITARQYENISVYVNLDSFASQTPHIAYKKGTTFGPRVRINGTGAVQFYNGSSWISTDISINTGSYYEIQLSNIDYSANTYTITVLDSSGNEVGEYTGAEFQSSIGEIDRIEILDFDANKFWVDSFHYGVGATDSAYYESTLHNVSNPQEAAINITEATNVSINATVRTDGGTVLNQTTLTNTGNHSLVLSSTSSEKVEIVLDVNVTGENPTFTLADGSILFTNHAPEVDNSTATPNSTATNNENVDLSIDVSDQEFGTVQGDNVTVTAYVDGASIGTKTISSNQTVNFTATDLANGSHSWHVEVEDEYGLNATSDTFSFEVNHYAPDLDNANASPQDNAEQTSRDITLSIPLEDIDFAEDSGDEVAVEFFVDDNLVDTVNVTTNGTVETTVTISSGGNHTWHAKATDEYGQTTTSDTFTFLVPAEITFRNEKNTSEILTNVNVNVTAYYGDETVRRNVTDGTLNLTGFPVDQPIIIRASGENYTTRTAVIESVYDQSNVYLLKENVATYEIRFDLQDATGEYPRDDTVLFVERDLDLNGSVEWRVISGDNFGVQGVPVTLEQDERYRLRVRNLETGVTATIGAFTPVQNETVTISPGSATIDIVDSESEYGWSVTENETGQYILFEYYDDVNETDSVKLTIHERFNKSNVLVDNETFTDANNIVYEIPMTANQTNKTWMAEIYVDRGGNVTHFREPITSGASNILPSNLGEHWASGVGVFIMLITGMAFSELNRSAGAVATALAGGMLWQLGFLSTVSTGPAIILAIGISVLYHYRTGGGQ